jgi:hypothetical protein
MNKWRAHPYGKNLSHFPEVKLESVLGHFLLSIYAGFELADAYNGYIG